MKKMTILFSILMITAPLLASEALNQGVFTSVTGAVEVLTNHRNERAKEDMTVVEGARITTEAGASAVLRLFDGSQLTISPNTDFKLTALQKPSADDKVIKFKLLLGTLSALVQKLTTSQSAFEIESGGVVCGVRGTQFSMHCDGGEKPKVTVQVTSGSVYTLDSFGHHFIVQPGGTMHFFNGNHTDNPSGSNNQGNDTNKKTANTQTNGNGTSAGGSSNTNGTNSGNTSGDSSGSNSSGANSTSNTNNQPSGPLSNPPGGTTGSDNGLADLNHQFQNNVLVNGDSTLTNPAVQQAIQININPVIGH
jgi:hypothetical protein